MFDYHKDTNDLCREVAAEGFIMLLKGHFTLYLYYTQSTETQWGRVKFIPEGLPDKGYTLADPRPIRGDRTQDQIHTFVAEVVQRLPILPPVDPITRS